MQVVGECSSGVVQKGGRGLDWMQVDGCRGGTTLLQRTYINLSWVVSLRCTRTPSPPPPPQPQTFPNEELSERSLFKDNGQSENKTWRSVLTRCSQLAGCSSESAGRPEWHSAEPTVHWSRPPPKPLCLSCLASTTTLIPSSWIISGDFLALNF